jgi:hypothetical protein
MITKKPTIKSKKVPLKKLWFGKLRIPDHIDYFEVYISKDIKEMITTINKWYHEKYGVKEFEKEEDFVGMFIQPKELTLDIYRTERLCGAIFLNLIDLTHHVISHELWHATTFYERGVIGYKGNYLQDYSQMGFCAEERGAYILESLTREIYNFCKQNKLRVLLKSNRKIKESKQ